MGYIVDGAILASCIGAYRVYTDRRKSVMHSNWDSYKHLWVNITRHSGDYLASACFDAICYYPSEARTVIDKAVSLLPISDDAITGVRDRVLRRTARYQIWAKYSHLGYLQRVVRLNDNSSIFNSSRAWKNNLVLTSPTLLGYVKDQSTRDYLYILSSVRDGFVGVLEGSPSEVAGLVSAINEHKRDILQDVRKGHILDRKAESAVPMLHALRMEIEGFLFGQSGPDADRSTYIEKAIKDGSEGVLERLYPYLEVIVDSDGESLRSGLKSVSSMAPNVDVFVPFLKLDDTVVGVGLGGNEFIIDPLVDGVEYTEPSSDGMADMSLGRSDSVRVQLVGHHGEAVKVRVVL